MRGVVLLAATAVVATLCLVIEESQASPSQRKRPEPTAAPKMAAATALPADEQQSSSSEEDDDSTSEEGDDEDLKIEGKTGKMCMKHPNIAAMESECISEYESMKKAKCNSTEPSVMDGIKEKMAEGLETVKNATMKAVKKVKEVMGVGDSNSTEPSATNTTSKHARRRRSCHFYHCMLKKMDALDEATKMPDEDKVMTWMSQYVTDVEDKKTGDRKTKQCFSDLRKNGVILSASEIAANAANTTMESSMPVTYVVHVPGACPRCKELSCVVYADGNPGKTECNAYSKLWMCLAEVESSECSGFKFQ
ncbi:uncharacterized protein LOC134528042 isoform X2 [Bacillus rossius redtenbacheri]|uniref:uncharacterized protein LOC134528042 isoform X2 n=1 Tax=Bacillus rossius redtenbacheri TaxID=93214 RepID=UPI002FDD61EA